MAVMLVEGQNRRGGRVTGTSGSAKLDETLGGGGDEN